MTAIAAPHGSRMDAGGRSTPVMRTVLFSSRLQGALSRRDAETCRLAA